MRNFGVLGSVGAYSSCAGVRMGYAVLVCSGGLLLRASGAASRDCWVLLLGFEVPSLSRRVLEQLDPTFSGVIPPYWP